MLEWDYKQIRTFLLTFFNGDTVDKYELFAKLSTLSTKERWINMSRNKIKKENMFWTYENKAKNKFSDVGLHTANKK